jgi:hypothetical protein
LPEGYETEKVAMVTGPANIVSESQAPVNQASMREARYSSRSTSWEERIEEYLGYIEWVSFESIVL